MRDYSYELFKTKDRVTALVCDLSRAEPKRTLDELAMEIDSLNKAWDALTDCLVRQREERNRTIAHLHDELAEARKR